VVAFWGTCCADFNWSPCALCSGAVNYFISVRKWDLGKLYQWVPLHLIPSILQCPISEDPSHNDELTWNNGSYSPFSISRADETLTHIPLQPNLSFKIIWWLKLPAKMKVHLGRLYHQSLLVAACIAGFIVTLLARCIICGNDIGDHMHLFRDCSFASATWSKFLPKPEVRVYGLFFCLSWTDRVSFNLSFTLSPVWPLHFAVTMWHIWCCRIRCVFDKTCLVTNLVWKKIAWELTEVFKMQDHVYNTE